MLNPYFALQNLILQQFQTIHIPLESYFTTFPYLSFCQNLSYKIHATNRCKAHDETSHAYYKSIIHY
jgi:hypothetical protein